MRRPLPNRTYYGKRTKQGAIAIISAIMAAGSKQRSQRGSNRANRSNQNPQPQLRQLLTNDVVVGSNDGADITIGGEEALIDPSVDNADGVASERGPDRERDRDRSESSETSPSRDNFNANPYDRASSQRRMREIRRRDNLHNAQQQQGHQ